jgi:hypothetical protein
MFATKEEVAELRTRAEAWKALDYIGADPMIPQVMDLFMKIPGIAPMWSCEGHFKDPEKGRKSHANFYIMFAVEERAYPVMQEIYLRLRERLMVHQRRADKAEASIFRQSEADKAAGGDGARNTTVAEFPRFSAVNQLNLTFSTRVHPNSKPEEDVWRWINVLIMNGQTYRKSSKSIFFRELVSTLVEVNAERNSN